MTSYNHTGLAICALLLTKDAPIDIKLATCAGLALSHLVADAIPHCHWYDFKKILTSKKDLLGAIVELGGGMLVMPILFSIFFHLNIWWMMLYTLSASALDILVGFDAIGTFKLAWASEINRIVHWWENTLDNVDATVFEVFQTIIIFLSVFLTWGGSI